MNPILDNTNFKYCVLFLRNSGNRIRAIVMVMHVAGVNHKQAKEYVDQGMRAFLELKRARDWGGEQPEPMNVDLKDMPTLRGTS